MSTGLGLCLFRDRNDKIILRNFNKEMFSYSVLKHINQVAKKFVRYKHPPNHWSVLRKKIHPVDKALQHFDDFYKEVFKKKWPSIREGLLGNKKYVAVVNNYGDHEETMAKLEMTGALNIRTLFHLEKEYIKEEIQKNKRNAALESIWKMDREMDMAAKEPDQGSTTKEPEQEQQTNAHRYSLQQSLENSEIDLERLVDSRNALSTELLNEYIPATKLKGNDDFIPESAHYKMFDDSSVFQVEKEYDIHFPENLNVYCYERANYTEFKGAKRASTDVLNYYLMDGGSILPVLALDLQPGCTVLDMCAAPGGKSLLALQTLYPDCVVSNDVSNSRVEKIEDVYRQFLFDVEERWLKTGRIKITHSDGRYLSFENFDRVLVDVPCTTDRLALKENINSMFKTSRTKERLMLPQLQSELLFSALKSVKKDGIVVYSTCSLSPIQNDGVVGMALRRIWEETKLEIIIKDLRPALLQARNVYQFADQKFVKFGHLVLPEKEQNFGPTYFCKLQRVK